MESVPLLQSEFHTGRAELLKKLYKSFKDKVDNDGGNIAADLTHMSINESFAGRYCLLTCLATHESHFQSREICAVCINFPVVHIWTFFRVSSHISFVSFVF